MTRRRSHAVYRPNGDDQSTNPSQNSTETSFLSTSSSGEGEQAEPESTQSSAPDGSVAPSVTLKCAETTTTTTTTSNVEMEVQRILANPRQAGEVFQPCRILDPRAVEECRLRRDGSDLDTNAQAASKSVTRIPRSERPQRPNTSLISRRKSDEGKDTASVPFESPRRKVSNVRLSLTLEGKAEVTEGPGPLSASLPRFVPRPSPGLQRSQSAVEPNPKPTIDFVLPSLGNAGRGRPGRSRDARTWEFFCDGGDAQDALTKRAEGEQAGSAVSAISLIRQNSSSALKLNAAKRNAARERDESCKRIKSVARQERGKLHRTQSSVARLQSSNPEKPSSKSRRGSLLDPLASGDSDKENWLPGTTEAPIRRPAPAPQVAGMNRGILRENMHLPGHSSSLDALLNSAKNSAKRKEKSVKSPDLVDNSIPNSQDAEDLDCVQSLLSLSQGAWQ